MGWLRDFFRPRPRRRRSAADDLACGWDRFFYVREWGCALSRAPEQVERALSLTPVREAGFAEGVDAEADNPELVFAVPFRGSVFLFCEGIGFSDYHERLSRPAGQAYTVFLDAKRYNILCSLAVDGRTLRQVGVNDDGSFDEGPGALEALHPSLGESEVLDLVATWGPDPRALVAEALAGRLCRAGRPEPGVHR
jgi:hypothetical protein